MSDVKPEVKPDPSVTDNKLVLMIRSSDNSELAFNVKDSTPFSKIANAYCKQKGISVAKSVRFLTEDGVRVAIDKTVAENELDPQMEENEDGENVRIAYVDAHMEQVGGGRRR